MGLHILALAKLNMVANSAHSRATPCTVTLLWPFLLKLSLSLRPIHENYANLFRSLRLFFFQLAQIALNDQNLGLVGAENIRNRWDRALRLVTERLARASRPMSEHDEDSLRNVSMLTL